MMCEACERGDHHQCGMQTWCDCDCGGPDDPASFMPFDVSEQPVFTHCNVCGRKLHMFTEDVMGMCAMCAGVDEV